MTMCKSYLEASNAEFRPLHCYSIALASNVELLRALRPHGELLPGWRRRRLRLWHLRLRPGIRPRLIYLSRLRQLGAPGQTQSLEPGQRRQAEFRKICGFYFLATLQHNYTVGVARFQNTFLNYLFID